jgi:hypothetical protein
MRVDLSHQALLFLIFPMSTAYKTQAPSEISTMDEDYELQRRHATVTGGEGLSGVQAARRAPSSLRPHLLLGRK